MGVNYGDKHLNCMGKLVVPIGTTSPPFWRINKPMNQWLVNMQHISAEKIMPIAEMINKEGFVYISDYPSIIYAIALNIKDLGLKVTTVPKFVFSGAEKMYENQRAVIEEAFPGIICTDHYGMSEGVCNASKCKHNVYHEDFEFGLLECEEKHWISESKYEGAILDTSFKNYGMPLIRYKTGDSAIWDTKPCSCGLHSQVILDIQGRIEDYVITPEGLKIQRFDYLFKDTRNIKECQVVQRELMKTNDYQPVFVLERIHEIMEEHGITDNRKVGLYGLTYKENVDDIRESPTLQMLDIQERHLARPLKTFDPFFTEKEIVKNQILDFDQFIKEVDMVVIMVKHDHIKQNWEKLKGKVILDCHNICPLEGVYHI